MITLSHISTLLLKINVDMVFAFPEFVFAVAAVSEPRLLRNGYIEVHLALRSDKRDGYFAAHRRYVTARAVEPVGDLRSNDNFFIAR